MHVPIQIWKQPAFILMLAISFHAFDQAVYLCARAQIGPNITSLTLLVKWLSLIPTVVAGAGAVGVAEHEGHRHSGQHQHQGQHDSHHGHHHGQHSQHSLGGGSSQHSVGGGSNSGQYRAQGTDSFGNPQAPQSGAAVYNADGQSVGTGNTSIRPGQTQPVDSSLSSGRPSAYDSPANQGSRMDRSDTGSGSGNTGSGSGNTGSGPSLASVVPGTQAYKDAHVRGNESGSNQGYSGSGSQGYSGNTSSGDIAKTT